MLFLSCGMQYTEILLLHMNWMICLNAVYLGVWTVSLGYRMEDQALPFLRTTSYILTAVPIILREQKEKVLPCIEKQNTNTTAHTVDIRKQK